MSKEKLIDQLERFVNPQQSCVGQQFQGLGMVSPDQQKARELLNDLKITDNRFQQQKLISRI